MLEGDDKVKTGDDLLLVGVKTVEKIIEEGGNPLPCVKHLRMLTEKVAKNVYKVDSLCKYDAAVCKRAGLEGVEEFGNIKHDEMFTYFTTILSKPQTFRRGRTKVGSLSRDRKSIMTSFVHALTAKTDAGSLVVSFMLVFFVRLGVSQRRIAMSIKRRRIPNRKLIVHARMGASLVIAKVLLNVTPPPRASRRSVIRPMNLSNLVWIGIVR